MLPQGFIGAPVPSPEPGVAVKHDALRPFRVYGQQARPIARIVIPLPDLRVTRFKRARIEAGEGPIVAVGGGVDGVDMPGAHFK